MTTSAPRLRLTHAEYLELERTSIERHEYLRGEVWAMARLSIRCARPT